MPFVMFWVLADALLIRVAYQVRDTDVERWSYSGILAEVLAGLLILSFLLLLGEGRPTTRWWMPRAAFLGAVAASVFLLAPPVYQITIG